MYVVRTLYRPGAGVRVQIGGYGRELTNSSPFPPQESGIRPGVSPSPVQEAMANERDRERV